MVSVAGDNVEPTRICKVNDMWRFPKLTGYTTFRLEIALFSP